MRGRRTEETEVAIASKASACLSRPKMVGALSKDIFHSFKSRFAVVSLAMFYRRGGTKQESRLLNGNK